MAEYHYDYGGQQPNGGNRRGNGKKDDGWGGWALIVFLFAIGIWPVALFLLFAKVFGNDAKKTHTAPPPLRTTARTSVERSMEEAVRQAERAAESAGRAAESAGRTAEQEVERALHHVERTARRTEQYSDGQQGQPNRAKAAAKSVVKSPKVKKSNARTMKIVGLLIAAYGIMCAIDPADMVFAGYVQNWIWELMQYLAVAVGGVGMFFGGLKMDAALRRYARYLAVMGETEAQPLSDLSRKLGWTERRVEKDLQKMIDKGYFGDGAYLNLELGYFFRSNRADEDLRKRKEAAQQAEPKAAPPDETEQGYSGILRNIRRANDRIADPVLTAKIDRLENITARIFKAVEEDPKKRNRIDTFLNYYLPTTQKLLDAYAEFDSAGVEGENLRQAKSRIETTMDSIVEGFEHQLDELYKSDVLDVDSDIRVMESMLHRDTASVEKDFGLKGGAKAKAAPNRMDLDFGGMAAQKKPEEE